MTSTVRVVVLFTSAAACLAMSSVVGAQAPAVRPSAAQRVDVSSAALRIDENAVLRRAPDQYRIELESTKSSWDAFRWRLEVRRTLGTIDQGTYDTLLASYTQGVGASTEGITSATAIMRALSSTPGATVSGRRAAQSAAGQQTLSDARATATAGMAERVSASSRLVASQAMLADAEVRLRIRSRRDDEDVDAVAAEAKAAMIDALAGPDAAAAQSYVKEKFPARLPGETALAYSTRMTEFSGGMSTMMSKGPIVADLKILTSPAGALVHLHPKYSPTLDRTANTDASFEKLFLGLYRVKVTLNGHQEYDQELNFLDDLQPTLQCTMAPAGTSSSTVCVRRRP